MTTQSRNMSMQFDLLSEPMQQRLQTRIEQHNGATQPVIEAVRAELATLDHKMESQSEVNHSSFQAQRALLIAQLAYLETVEQTYTSQQ